jgi:hypothetical protein
MNELKIFEIMEKKRKKIRRTEISVLWTWWFDDSEHKNNNIIQKHWWWKPISVSAQQEMKEIPAQTWQVPAAATSSTHPPIIVLLRNRMLFSKKTSNSVCLNQLCCKHLRTLHVLPGLHNPEQHSYHFHT